MSLTDLTQAATIFASQFILVFLLGLQSQHIRDGKKLSAAITSALLGVVGWTTTGIISEVYSQGMFSIVFAAFCASGPIAISLSIYLHEHFKEKKCLT